MRNSLTLLPLILLLCSCGNDNLPKVEILKGFRILGISATNPEVAPGGSSTLSVLISDTEGGGRVINGSYIACVDPGIALGAEATCLKDPTAISGTYTIDTTVPDLANNLYTGFSGTLGVTIPASILDGRSEREKFNGVGYIVIFTFQVDGRRVTSFKRIISTNRGVLNSNPAAPTILVNGGAVSGIPREDDRLSVTGLNPESYQFQNVDGTIENRQEDLDVAWYLNSGEVNKPKASSLDQVEITEAPSGPFLILSVVRDGRGGLSVQRNFIP